MSMSVDTACGYPVSSDMLREYAVSISPPYGHTVSVDITCQMEAYAEGNYHMVIYEEAAAMDGNAVRSKKKYLYKS